MTNKTIEEMFEDVNVSIDIQADMAMARGLGSDLDTAEEEEKIRAYGEMSKCPFGDINKDLEFWIERGQIKKGSLCL